MNAGEMDQPVAGASGQEVPHTPGMGFGPSRRTFLRGVGAAAAAVTLAPVSPLPALAAPAASTTFAHGVASGDPLPDGVLLWTRVTPSADAVPGSGRGPDVTVNWEVATEQGFSAVVASGTIRTGAARDHTVKVDVRGLKPATRYWYRFRLGEEASPAGQTRTAPAAGAAVEHLRWAVVSCANLQAGWFSAYRHLAARDDLDLVLHLGDYLYEFGPGEYQARDVVVRPHDPAHEMVTLEDYRRRHAQYKRDKDLQALHAKVPFVVTWDDHEFADNAWSGGAGNHTEGTEGTWSARRAASQQAYAEWMPVRYEVGGKEYRRLEFGTLASLSMLDLRSYRSQQVQSRTGPGPDDPARTITGDEQMAWLLGGLSAATARWKLVGNPVMIAPLRFPPALSDRERDALSRLTGSRRIDGVPYNTDQWDGYTADRNEVVRHLQDGNIKDTVFLTGDIHSGWACDLPGDQVTYPLTGESVATELICTSVTSDNLDDKLRVPPHTASRHVESVIKVANPHVKYVDFDSHGFSVLHVTPAAVRMEWYVLSERTDPAATAAVSTSWRVAAGTQQVREVSGAQP